MPLMSHPLLKATLKGDVAMVRQILSDVSKPFHSIFPSELSTAVHYATQLADPVAITDLIAALAAAGASLTDLDYDSEEVLRPLGHAAMNPYPAGAAAALRALVAAGVSVHDHDADGGLTTSALHHAARNRNPRAAVSAISTLLELGGDVDAETLAGHTPLHWAAWYGTSEAVDALLAAGADPEAVGHQGTTPLHAAALNTYPRSAAACIASLVAAGADVDAFTHDGQTPLHFALRNQSPEAVKAAVKALLDAGADPSAQDSAGRTPLHMISRADHPAMDMLVAAGAPVDIPDTHGRTPLSEAWVHRCLHTLIKYASPPPAVVFASLAHSPLVAWAWIPFFVEVYGFPSEEQWALVPLEPFPFLASLLPHAPPADASEIVRRMHPVDVKPLRESLLCLNRFLHAAIGSRIACLAAANGQYT